MGSLLGTRHPGVLWSRLSQGFVTITATPRPAAKEARLGFAGKGSLSAARLGAAILGYVLPKEIAQLQLFQAGQPDELCQGHWVKREAPSQPVPLPYGTSNPGVQVCRPVRSPSPLCPGNAPPHGHREEVKPEPTPRQRTLKTTPPQVPYTQPQLLLGLARHLCSHRS